MKRIHSDIMELYSTIKGPSNQTNQTTFILATQMYNTDFFAWICMDCILLYIYSHCVSSTTTHLSVRWSMMVSTRSTSEMLRRRNTTALWSEYSSSSSTDSSVGVVGVGRVVGSVVTAVSFYRCRE